MSISAAAYEALQRLDDGERLNTTHRLARELIAANLAHAGFGILEITEAGRIWLRRGVTRQAFIVEDENVANLGGMSMPGPPSPPPPPLVPDNPDHVPSPVPPGWHPPLVLPPEPETMPPAPLLNDALAWSRDRAIRAAGIANGQTSIWVDSAWVEAFMIAYEGAAP